MERGHTPHMRVFPNFVVCIERLWIGRLNRPTKRNDFGDCSIRNPIVEGNVVEIRVGILPADRLQMRQVDFVNLPDD